MSGLPRWAKGIIVGLAIGLIGAAFGLTAIGEDFEKNVGLDWLFQIRGPIASPANVAVVAIDERTGPKIGVPALLREWPRSVHGRLVDELTRRGAAAIVFDMDFSRSRSAEEDAQFADKVAKSGRVLLFQKLDGKRQPIPGPDGRPAGFVWVEQTQSPAPPLDTAARALAPFPLPKVQVNVYRFWTFKPSAGDAASLPAAALRLYALRAYPAWRHVLEAAGARGLEALPKTAGDIASPAAFKAMMQAERAMFRGDPGLAVRVAEAADRADRAGLSPSDRRTIAALVGLYTSGENPFLNFYGPPGTIKTIPYSAFLTADPAVRESDLDVRGKIVFVGFSDLYDPGQPDRFYTVFTGRDGVDLSGVEIMATATANLLTRSSIRPSGTLATVLILFAFGCLMGAGIYILPAILAVPLALVLAAGYGAAVQWGFNHADAWYPLATPVLGQLPLALFAGLLGQYMFERREKRRFTEELSYYLPEHVLRDLTKGGADATALNKIVHGTCLATDMAGFTTLSEELGPSGLAEFMNAYYEAIAEPLKRNGVDMTEFHADMIMCAWLSPDSSPVPNRAATYAALDVSEAISRFGESRSRPLYPRVGMDFGQFYLGHAGGGGRFAFSILGDTANTAARLESLNKHLGTHLLASGIVVAGANDLLLRPVGTFRLVGKADPTPIVEIVARRDSATPAQVLRCERFAEALDAFQVERWSKAADLFESFLGEHAGDGPAAMYLDYARRYASEPPTGEEPSIIHMDAK